MRWMQNLAAMARSNTASMFMVYNVPMQRFILCLLAVLASASALAANQSLPALERLADGFLRQELTARKASYQLGHLDKHLAVPACAQPQAGWANTAKTTGATFVALSCPAQGWQLRLPVTIHEKRLGVVLNRAVAAGEVLSTADVQLVEVANPALAQNVLADLSQAIGHTMRSGAPAGAWLRGFMVRMPFLVRANQRVRVLAQGDGFDVVADGTAIANAALGESVSVRMASGRVVRGVVAEDGSVAVTY